jgi:hypothetical protein
MKPNETLKPKVPAFSGAIALFVLFGLMFISSLHLEKKWDAIACAVVCVVGLVGLASFFFAERHHPAERRAGMIAVVLGAVFSGVAAIAHWLIYRHWH